MVLTAAERTATIAACLPDGRVAWFRQQLQAWAAVSLRDFPWRRDRAPYKIFVAECLLQKTDAATVVPIYTTFLQRYPTLADLIAAPLPELQALLQPLGLAFRAERLQQAAHLIRDRHGGNLPTTETELLRLPGIGPYTARAICSQAFDLPAPVLDTNVARILERFFGLTGGDRVKSRCKLLWQAAERVATTATTTAVGRWNLTLIDFGALICQARQPACDRCPLQARCCLAVSSLPAPDNPVNLLPVTGNSKT